MTRRRHPCDGRLRNRRHRTQVPGRTDCAFRRISARRGDRRRDPFANRSNGTVTVVAACGGGQTVPRSAPMVPSMFATTAASSSSKATPSISSPINQPTDYLGGSIQRGRPRQGKSPPCTPAATATVFGDQTTSSSTLPEVSGSPIAERPGPRPDWGSVYYARPDGSFIREVIHPLDAPNGIGLSPEGDRLYVTETSTGRVWRWDIREPASSITTVSPAGAAIFWLHQPAPRSSTHLRWKEWQSLRRHALQRRHHGLPPRRNNRVHALPRPAGDQHLLRRPRSHARLCDPFITRATRTGEVAPPWPRFGMELSVLSADVLASGRDR